MIKKYFKLHAGAHHINSAKTNPMHERFYNIISEVGKLSGHPLVLNTSFNINGEPIVQSPDDALNTFFNSKLDVLVIGDYMVKK